MRLRTDFHFIAVGIAALTVALSMFHVGPVHAGDRVMLTGSSATFEMPAGWKRAPATSDVPSVILWLCREGSEPLPDDQCTVRAELNVAERRAIASLDATFAEWQALPADTIMSPPRRFAFADGDALEVATHGDTIGVATDAPYPTHKPQNIVTDTIARKAGDEYYTCNLTLFDASDYMALQSVVQSLCGSLHAPQTSG